VFSRLAAPDGPYDSLQLGLSAVDADGAALAGYDMSYSAAGACAGAGCNAKAVGAAGKQRFGRLWVGNANGSILASLRAPAQTQYWNSAGGVGIGWTVNTLDSCTSIPYADMSVGGYKGGVSSASLPGGSMAFSAGQATLVATRSGGVSSGSAYVGVNLGAASAAPNSCGSGLSSVPGASMSWLQSNFCTGTYGANPNAYLIWGAAAGKSGMTIFLRESY
jgi:hypothetical protein